MKAKGLWFYNDNSKLHPELAVVGQRSDFYVFDIKKPFPWSKRVTSSQGSLELWEKFSKARKANDKVAFQLLIDEIFKEN